MDNRTPPRGTMGKCMAITEEEYQALWAAYDKSEAEWRAQYKAGGFSNGNYVAGLPPQPERPMLSRVHVREAARLAYLEAKADGATDPEATGAAVGATMELEPRWTASDALDHFRRMVRPHLP